MDRYWADWKFSGIYIIAHVPSGRRYVGQSADIARRISEHMYHNTNCKRLAHAMKAHGNDEFEAIVAERVDDTSTLTEREQYWIDELHSANPEIGYNLAPVAKSMLGYKHSPETCARASESHLGHKRHTAESRARISDALKGRTLSEETRAKLRGRKHSEETRAKMKGHAVSAETRAKLSMAARNRQPISEETRVKMSAAARNRQPVSAETRAKQSAARQNISEETRARMSASHKLSWDKRRAEKIKDVELCPITN